MRKYYIDNIRWITVVLVVIYHVIYIYNSIITEGLIGPFHKVQYQDGIMYVLYPWFMAILFVISGISSRYYLESHTDKEFLKSRTRKLLVPSTIGLFTFQWIMGYFNMLLADAFSNLPKNMPLVAIYFLMSLTGTGVLWYIQVLWVLSMVLLFVRKFEKGKLYERSKRANIVVLILLVIPLWLFAQILNTPIIPVYRFGIYGFCFFLGYFVFAHEEIFDRLVKYRYLLIAIAVLLGGCYVAISFGKNYVRGELLNGPLPIAYAWFAILAIFAAAKKWGNKTSKFAAFMNKKNFGLYVFHYLTLAVMAYCLDRYWNVPAIPAYLIVAVAAFGGGMLLFEIISRIPVLRWCVLGIKKQR